MTQKSILDEHKKQSVAGVIFTDDRQNVLLIKRRDVPVWVLPGGGLEINESAEEGIIREVLEETGFSIAIKKKVGEYFPANRLTCHTHLFECQIIGGSAQVGDETREIAYFEIGKLPKLIPPPYGEWIADALKNPDIPYKKTLAHISYGLLVKNMLRHPLLVLRFLLARLGVAINT